MVFDSEDRLVTHYHKVRIICVLVKRDLTLLLFVICIYTCLLNVGERTVMNTFLNYYMLVEKGI